MPDDKGQVVRRARIALDLSSFIEVMHRIMSRAQVEGEIPECLGWVTSTGECLACRAVSRSSAMIVYSVGPGLKHSTLYSSLSTVKAYQETDGYTVYTLLEFIDDYDYVFGQSFAEFGPPFVEFADYVIREATRDAERKEDLTSLQKELRNHQKNRNRLREELAKVGFDLKLRNQLDSEEEAIKDLEEQIQELEQSEE